MITIERELGTHAILRRDTSTLLWLNDPAADAFLVHYLAVVRTNDALWAAIPSSFRYFSPKQSNGGTATFVSQYRDY